MNHLGRFFAISAFSLGLTSVASAQPPAPQTDTVATPARSTLPPRQVAFQHPILEQRSSHDLRYAQEGPRIQRRGMSPTRTDGAMQRSVTAGAADSAATARSGQSSPR